MNLCGGYIAAYRVGAERTAARVRDTVRDALTREKGKVANGLVVHSDQGRQHTFQEYYALTRKCRFAASMFRYGYPHDNAVIEDFLAPLKLNAYTGAPTC